MRFNKDTILEDVLNHFSLDSIHGLTGTNYSDFTKLLKTAAKNEDIFPSFTADNGIIEHIHVAPADYQPSLNKHSSYLDGFHACFKDQWEKHIDILKRHAKSQTVCFLVSSEDVLEVRDEWTDSLHLLYGDLAKHRCGGINFCLSYDEEMLDFIYDYKYIVDYVIYFNAWSHYTETIKLSNIAYLKEFMKKRSYSLLPCVVPESLNYLKTQ